MKKIRVKVVLVLLISVILFSCKKDENNNNPETGTKVGNLAPDFELRDINSDTIKLDDFKGNMVVVDFWASWCHFCRDENPVLVSLYNNFNSKGLEIIGVSLDENVSNWQNAVIDDGLEFIQVIDTEAFNSQIAKDYRITSIPRMFLLDENGLIIAVTSDASALEPYISNRLD